MSEIQFATIKKVAHVDTNGPVQPNGTRLGAFDMLTLSDGGTAHVSSKKYRAGTHVMVDGIVGDLTRVHSPSRKEYARILEQLNKEG